MNAKGPHEYAAYSGRNLLVGPPCLPIATRLVHSARRLNGLIARLVIGLRLICRLVPYRWKSSLAMRTDNRAIVILCATPGAKYRHDSYFEPIVSVFS